MQWIAPPEKDPHTDTLEKQLWATANQLWAGAGLKQSDYSEPILGLIFLRFAEVRFLARRAVLEKVGSSSRRGSRVDDLASYHEEGVLFLAPGSLFGELLRLPEGANIGKAVNEAMKLIERDNPHMAGVLPKGYQIFESRLLASLLKSLSAIPADLEGDTFGKIYEYFLGTFAMSEGQKGGEFFTPPSQVKLIVEILEPFRGRILDRACGSGGMFVQSARFVQAHRSNPSDQLAIHGQERIDGNVRLCRMNLAIHGLEGDIRHGNSYYEDPFSLVGKFDFVCANPPFNVSQVDKERLAAEVGPGRRYPFGLPRTDNANYLWIQDFWSALGPKGRAGFVMANSASDARASEQEIRRQFVQSRTVDVMVAVGPNMFYTVTLPCTLWFFDKAKAQIENPNSQIINRRHTVLFLDARHIYRQIDRAHREWTDAQIGFLANVVRLYRGEAPDFTLGGEEAQAKLEEIFGSDAGIRFAASQPARNAQGSADTPARSVPKLAGRSARITLAYRDIPGLCKAATLAEIEAQGWSLNPGRYVGVAPGETVSDEDFKTQLGTWNEELETLNAQARELEQTIAANVAEILEA